MGLFGFGWKASDEICPKHHIRAAAAGFFTESVHITSQMPAFHTFENQIITMLNRQMQMRHQAGMGFKSHHQIMIRFSRI